MNPQRRRQFADRLDAASKILREVAREIQADPDSTEAERASARRIETEIVLPLNPHVALLRF